MALDQNTIDSVVGQGLTTDYAANRSALSKDQAAREALLPKIEQAKQDEAGIQSRTAQEEAPVREQIGSFQPRQSQLQTPQAPKPFEAPKLDPMELKQAAGAMLVVSGLLGAFTRNGWSNAITNMTAAMKGLREGNEEATKTAKLQYDENVSNFKTQLEALKADRESLEKMDQSDLGALRRQLEYIAHKNDAELIAAQAKTHSYTDTLQALDKHIASMEGAISKAQTAAASIQRSIDYHDKTTRQPASSLAVGKPKVFVGEDGKAYSQMMTRDGQIITRDAMGRVVNPDGAPTPVTPSQTTMRNTVKLDISEIDYALENMRSHPGQTASIFFQDKGKGTLARWYDNKLTPEEYQEYDVYANRIATAIAGMQSMGRGQVSDEKIRQAQKLVPVPGDSDGTIQTKFAQIQRIRDNANQILAGKTPDQIQGGHSDKDKEALDWANAHPDDPRSAKIKAHLGM